jgi:SSS family solute:Na+ symporter
MSSAAERHLLSGWDVATIVLYFVVLFGIGVYVSRRQAAAQREQLSSESFFLAERSVPHWAVAMSLFASNIGSEHFVGLAGSAASSGLAVGWYEWGAMPILVGLGYVFLPLYSYNCICTMPEYIERRFDSQLRTALVALSLVLYVFTKISATLFAGQLVLAELAALDPFTSAVCLIVGTTLYTVTGGLAAVIYTEAMQTVVLLAGGFILMAAGLDAVGGWAQLVARSPPQFFHMIRPTDDPEYPWTGFIPGYFFMSIWYWCGDQVIVQRALAAKNVAHGRAGCVVAGLLKVIPVFIMCVPGICARVLMEERGHINASDAAAGRVDPGTYDRSYPWLIAEVLPQHTKGLLIAAIVASLMSSLASVFNSSSTLFTLDVYAKAVPEATEGQKVWVGRCTVVVMAVLSMLWLPIIPLFGSQLFMIVQAPPAYLAPPISALFVFGALSPTPNATGARWTMAFGVVFGSVRFAMDISSALSAGGARRQEAAATQPAPGPGSFQGMQFLHFCSVNFVCCTVILFGVSVITAWRTVPAGSEGGRRGVRDDHDTATAASEVQRGESSSGSSRKGVVSSLIWNRNLYADVLRRDNLCLHAHLEEEEEEEEHDEEEEGHEDSVAMVAIAVVHTAPLAASNAALTLPGKPADKERRPTKSSLELGTDALAFGVVGLFVILIAVFN